MMQVTKSYGHEAGLSATFRQWRAKSHCRFIHGYALAFHLTFACHDNEVNENGWVIDFGSLKPVKAWLAETFDHKTLVAADDPLLNLFRGLSGDGDYAVQDASEWDYFETEGGAKRDPLIQLTEVERTGCEAFAKMVASHVQGMLKDKLLGDTRAWLVSVECREHDGNGATYVCQH